MCITLYIYYIYICMYLSIYLFHNSDLSSHMETLPNQPTTMLDNTYVWFFPMQPRWVLCLWRALKCLEELLEAYIVDLFFTNQLVVQLGRHNQILCGRWMETSTTKNRFLHQLRLACIGGGVLHKHCVDILSQIYWWVWTWNVQKAWIAVARHELYWVINFLISLRTCFCSSVSAASNSSGPNGVISAGTGYCTRPRRAKRGSALHPSERIWSKSLRKTFKVLQLRYLHRLPLVASASRNHLGLQGARDSSRGLTFLATRKKQPQRKLWFLRLLQSLKMKWSWNFSSALAYANTLDPVFLNHEPHIECDNLSKNSDADYEAGEAVNFLMTQSFCWPSGETGRKRKGSVSGQEIRLQRLEACLSIQNCIQIHHPEAVKDTCWEGARTSWISNVEGELLWIPSQYIVHERTVAILLVEVSIPRLRKH